ncbi:PqqD family protein [Actinophytocola sediminis]
MRIDERSVLEPSPDRPARDYLKGVVIEPGITLNESAGEVYRLFDGVRSVRDICDRLTAQYEVDHETVLADVTGLADELLAEGVLRPVGASLPAP